MLIYSYVNLSIPQIEMMSIEDSVFSKILLHYIIFIYTNTAPSKYVCPELKISLNFFLKLVAFLMISGNGLHLRLILILSNNGPEMPRAVRI